MDGPSRTALMVAAYRARATSRKDAICNDPWAAALAGDDGLALARAYDATFEHMELWVALRTRFLDDCIVRFLDGGFAQVVLLGAGFDMRASRLAREGVRFFEVDRRESQEAKLERLARLEGFRRERATYVTCDFEKEDFLDRLAGAGFRAEEPAIFVWEGVTAYLTEPAVRTTLRRLAGGTSPRTVLAFDHLRRKIVAGDVRDPKDLESRAFVESLSEPLRFGIDYPLPMLYEEGFRRVRMLTFDEIALDYMGTYDRARAFRFQGMVLASREEPLP